MAPGTPSVGINAAQENAEFIIKAMMDQAQSSGKMDEKMQQFFAELRITLPNRLGLLDDQGKSMRDLFTHRKDAAKKLTDGIIDIGMQASKSEIDLFSAAEKIKLDSAGKATGLNLQNLSIIEEKKAGWSGFWTIAADLCRGIGFDAGANWCQDRADANAPKMLDARLTQLDALKGKVKIDPSNPVERALSVFQAALIPTNPDNARVGAAAGVEMQTAIDAARASSSQQAPALIATMPGVTQASPTAAASSSAGDIEKMASEILKRVGQQVNLDAAKIKGLTRDIVGIEVAHTKDGKLTTPVERKEFEDALTKRGLADDQKAKVREAFGVPAPALN